MSKLVQDVGGKILLVAICESLSTLSFVKCDVRDFSELNREVATYQEDFDSDEDYQRHPTVAPSLHLQFNRDDSTPVLGSSTNIDTPMGIGV